MKPKKTIQSPEKLAKSRNKFINETVGLCSFSESNNNLLMWGHYTGNHKGFCAEYDGSLLVKYCENNFNINEKPRLFKINYDISYPSVNPYDKSESEIEKYITTKSSDWHYEEEWRLIYFNHSDEPLKLPDYILKAIYFGVNCSEEKIKECIEIMKNRKTQPALYKAKLKQKEFGITFVKI